MSQVAQPKSTPLVQLYEDQLRVVAGDKALELTAMQFHLLQTLSQSVGRIYSRDELMDRIYADRRIMSKRTIDSHMKKLRKEPCTLLSDQDVI